MFFIFIINQDPTHIYSLSLHDALPISVAEGRARIPGGQLPALSESGGGRGRGWGASRALVARVPPVLLEHRRRIPETQTHRTRLPPCDDYPRTPGGDRRDLRLLRSEPLLGDVPPSGGTHAGTIPANGAVKVGDASGLVPTRG